jgi:hypothetical protein
MEMQIYPTTEQIDAKIKGKHHKILRNSKHILFSIFNGGIRVGSFRKIKKIVFIIWFVIWTSATIINTIISVNDPVETREESIKYEDIVKFTTIIKKDYVDVSGSGNPYFATKSGIIENPIKLSYKTNCDLIISQVQFYNNLLYTVDNINDVDGCEIDIEVSYILTEDEIRDYQIIHMKGMYIKSSKTVPNLPALELAPDLGITAKIDTTTKKVEKQYKRNSLINSSAGTQYVYILADSNYFYSISLFNTIRNIVIFSLSFLVIRSFINLLFDIFIFYIPSGITRYENIVHVEGKEEALFLV